MISGRELKFSLMKNFFFTGLIYAILNSTNWLISDTLEKYSSFEVKKMVLGRVLFSEFKSFKKMGVEDLDDKITSDIESTLELFNRHLPSLLTSFGAFSTEITISLYS